MVNDTDRNPTDEGSAAGKLHTHGILAPVPVPPKAKTQYLPRFSPTDEDKQKFLSKLEQVGNIAMASTLVFGHNYSPNIRRICKIDPVFNRAIETAIETAGTKFWKILQDTVLEGEKTYVTNKNGVIRDKDGNPLFNVKRDSKLLLRLVEHYDKSFVHTNRVEVNTTTHGPDVFVIRPADLAVLGSSEIRDLEIILKKISASRVEEQIDDNTISERLKPAIEDAEFHVLETQKESEALNNEMSKDEEPVEAAPVEARRTKQGRHKDHTGLFEKKKPVTNEWDKYDL